MSPLASHPLTIMNWEALTASRVHISTLRNIQLLLTQQCSRFSEDRKWSQGDMGLSNAKRLHQGLSTMQQEGSPVSLLTESTSPEIEHRLWMRGKSYMTGSKTTNKSCGITVETDWETTWKEKMDKVQVTNIWSSQECSWTCKVTGLTLLEQPGKPPPGCSSRVKIK